MGCENCSYIKDELDSKINWYLEKESRYDTQNNIYQSMTYDEIINYEIEYCWCEKIGGKLCWYGQCSDAYSNEIKHKNHSNKKKRNKKKRNKRERDFKYKQHLKYLSKSSRGYPAAVYPIDKYGRYIWFPDNIPKETIYYKRCYRSNNGKTGCSRYCKKISNRKIRRYKGEISNGFWCHKLYGYWWEIY